MNAVVNYARDKFKNPFQPDGINLSTGGRWDYFVEHTAVTPNNDVYLGKLIFNLRNRLVYCIKTPCNDPNNQRLEVRDFFKDVY
jgi:hypothetical protein